MAGMVIVLGGCVAVVPTDGQLVRALTIDHLGLLPMQFTFAAALLSAGVGQMTALAWGNGGAQRDAAAWAMLVLLFFSGLTWNHAPLVAAISSYAFLVEAYVFLMLKGARWRRDG